MLTMIYEGGIPGMITIIAIGLILIIREFFNLIKRNRNNGTFADITFIGCATLMIFSIGWSLLACYTTFQIVTPSGADYNTLLIGIKESITPMIFGFLLTSIALTIRGIELIRAKI